MGQRKPFASRQKGVSRALGMARRHEVVQVKRGGGVPVPEMVAEGKHPGSRHRAMAVMHHKQPALPHSGGVVAFGEHAPVIQHVPLVQPHLVHPCDAVFDQRKHRGQLIRQRGGECVFHDSHLTDAVSPF